MLIFLIWLANFIDKLNLILLGLLFASLAVIGCNLFLMLLTIEKLNKNDEEIFSKAKKALKKSAVYLGIFSATFAFVPSKNTYYAMVGVYAGQEIIDNPKAQTLFDKSIKVVEAKLDQIINESEKE